MCDLSGVRSGSSLAHPGVDHGQSMGRVKACAGARRSARDVEAALGLDLASPPTRGIKIESRRGTSTMKNENTGGHSGESAEAFARLTKQEALDG